MYTEPLLEDNPYRYVIFPIQYHDMWKLAITQREAFWNESEIDLSRDKKDWVKLSDGEKHFIKNVLAFFAASDGIVLENLALKFMKEIQIPEARSFYSFQMAMETIHGITYSLLLDTYITDLVEKDKLFKAIETVPSVGLKAAWAQKWIASTDSFAKRLVAFACVEGIFFSGSFCCIYWIKERGILPGLCQSNDLIARDEGLHVDFAVLLYAKYVENKLSDEEVHEMVKEAVHIEETFITESIPCRLLGMNAELMKEYIQFVANRLVKQLGHKEVYPNAKQPFAFMDRICFSSKGNFFEKETTQYRMRVETTQGNTNDDLVFDADF
jgi:ribonucleotide reductase beta subunit family protein with ferritin-like domain